MTDVGAHLTPNTPPLGQRDLSVGKPSFGDPSALASNANHLDPLRLCVNATVALLTLLLGPIALLGFAVIAIFGYARARRAGLLRSKCKLGDTRVVLVYLSVLAALGAAAIPFWISLWMRLLGG